MPDWDEVVFSKVEVGGGKLCGPGGPLPLQVKLTFPGTLILLLLILNLLIFEVLSALSLPQGSLGFCKTESGLLLCIHMVSYSSHIPVCGAHLCNPIIQLEAPSLSLALLYAYHISDENKFWLDK